MNATAAKVEAAPAQRWTGRSRGGVGNRAYMWVLRTFGLGVGYAILVPVALYFVFFAPRASRAAAEYRRRMGLERRGIFRNLLCAFRHFFSFGQILIDRVFFIGGEGDRFSLSFEGEKHIARALAARRGLILVSAHCGNWEVAAHCLQHFDATVNIVMLTAEADVAREYLERFKGRQRLIAADGSADASLAIASALSRGEIVAMHGDRFLASELRHTAEADFLGAPARFPLGPYLVAAVTGAPLLHCFVMRSGPLRYHFVLHEARELRFGRRSERRAALEGWLRAYVADLEAVLRRFPLQWHNFFPFWSEHTGATA